MHQQKPILKSLAKVAIICSLLSVWGCNTLPTASSTPTPKEAVQQSYNQLLNNSFNYQSKSSNKVVQEATTKTPKREKPVGTINLNNSDHVENTLDFLLNSTASTNQNQEYFSYTDAINSFLDYLISNSSSITTGAYYPKELQVNGVMQTNLNMRNIQASLNIPYAIDIKNQTIKVGLYDLMPLLGKKGTPYQDKAVLVQGKDYKELGKALSWVTQNHNKIIGAMQDGWTQIDPKAFTDQSLTSAERAAGGQRKVRFIPTKENIKQIMKGISVSIDNNDLTEMATNILNTIWPDEISGVYIDFVLNRQGQLVKLDQMISFPMPSFLLTKLIDIDCDSNAESNTMTLVTQSTTILSNYGKAKSVFNPKESDLVSARTLQSILTGKSIAQIEADDTRKAADADNDFFDEVTATAEEVIPVRRSKASKAKTTSTKGKKKARSKAK